MTFLNRKNLITFSFTGFVVALALASFAISVTAQDLTLSGPTCPTSLVSWWNGDKVSRTSQRVSSVLDLKGGNAGILYDTHDTTPGRVGNAFNLSGSYEYVAIKNSANLNFGTGPFSLEAWFNWNARRKANINDIIRKSNYPVEGPGAGYWLRIGVADNSGTKGKLEFFVGETVGIKDQPRGSVTTPISPNVWYHVVATRDSSGTMKLYVNGELKGTAKAPGANATSQTPFTIGAWEDRFGATEFFSGLIDEVSVYNKALSEAEAQAIFNTGSDGKCHKPSPTPTKTPEPSKPPVSVSPTPTKTPAPLSDISYPVRELGNCANQQECKVYCSVANNYSKCATFAQKNNLTVLVPAVYTAMQKGESPGQCRDEASCRKYCEDMDHIEECVSFVEKFNLANADELKEMRKMADIKKSGVAFPGNCKTKESCMKYCENSTTMAVCMEFALKAGFIPKDEIEVVNKILLYLKSGGKLPGGCATKESCDTYCANDTHAIECVDFAVGAGFMTKEDADIVRKTGGKGPGNCRSREACDSYCKNETHTDECVDFAVKAGLISKDDAAQAKKYKITSGPGGCKSKADCEAFCVLPANQDTCFKFAKDHGMISEEDLKNIEKYKNQGPPDFSQVDPKWLACVEKEMGPAIFGRFKAGKSERSDTPAVGAAQKKCQSEMGPDIRKEIEVCLSKTTCAEFNSCFDTLPKSNQQSSGKETQDESGKKIQTRVLACFQEKIDACLTLSCSEFDVCIKSVQQGGGGQQKQQGQGTQDPKVNAKVQACIKEKVNVCLAKSCSEFQACLNSLGGGGEGKQQGGTTDPAVTAKFTSCQPPKPSGGDQSGIPQGYSSWAEFCKTNYGDSRCSAYTPKYPLLPQPSFLGAILRYFFK